MRWLARHRAGFDVLISLVGIVAIALVGLVIEDALPTDGPRVFINERVIPLVVSVALLLILVWLRTRLRLGHGTIYFIRYLEEWMSDWYRERELAEAHASMDVRAVARTMRRQLVGDVLDVVDDVTGLGRDLQLTMNEDDSSTGFQLAPNMAWPAAMSLGYDLYGDWLSIDLVELGPKPYSFVMPLHACPTPHGPSMTVRVQRNGAATPVKTVLVTIDLAARRADGSLGVTMPSDWQWDSWYRLAAYGPRDPSHPSADEGRSSIRPVLIAKRPDTTRPDHVVIAPEEIVCYCTEVIRTAIHQNHGSTVLVAASLPKVVALAIGWRLRNGYPDQRQAGEPDYVRCQHEACRHPWRSIVPLNFDQLEKRYLLARVHASQPEPEGIAAKVTRCHLPHA